MRLQMLNDADHMLGTSAGCRLPRSVGFRPTSASDDGVHDNDNTGGADYGDKGLKIQRLTLSQCEQVSVL